MNKRSICFVYNTSQYLYKFRLELMESLLKDGYSVYAIAPVDRYSTKFQMHNIKFISIVVDRRGYNIFKDIKLVWSLTNIYRKISPLIVHHFTIKPVLYGSLAGRLAKIPKIINSITGLGYTFINSSWIKWLICKLYYISQKSDKIQLIFQNSDDRDFFLDNNLIRNNQSNLILSSGVNLEIFKCSDSQRGRDTHQCTFLFLSRILYDKGIVELVEAMKMVFKSNEHVKLIIAGDVDLGCGCGEDGPEDGFDCDGVCGGNDVSCLAIKELIIPQEYSITSIYPNPFNPATKITYGLPENTDTQIIVFDLNGTQITTLVNTFQTAGYYIISWDADNLPSGVYLIRMESGNFTQIQKVMLVK